MAIKITVPPRVYDNVVGFMLVAVQKHQDDSLTIERDIRVCADNREDNDTVEAFIKELERKLDDVLPEPEPVVEGNIWVPE